MLIVPRGLTARYLRQGGKWYVGPIVVSRTRLRAILEHAAVHHETDTDEELEARSIFRYACHHPASWLLPNLLIISAIAMVIWLLNT